MYWRNEKNANNLFESLCQALQHKKDCRTCFKLSFNLFSILIEYSVSLWRLLLCKVWRLRGNHSVHLSPVATKLSRSRLQSGNYLFTRSSSAGDLPMLIPPLSLVYCLHRQVQTCLSIVCYSTRVVLCGDTTVCECFSCSCSIS